MIPTIHALCGQSGAGKTSLGNRLKEHEGPALLYSVDRWMNRLFTPDLVELDMQWIAERVLRVEEQILEVAAQALDAGISVILDLGFQSRNQRERAYRWAAGREARFVLHYLDVPVEVRRRRVLQRNSERRPEVYSFEVTEFMFDVMEQYFEEPRAEAVPGEYRHYLPRPRNVLPSREFLPRSFWGG